MSAPIAEQSVAVGARPARLNLAGWCVYCTQRFCESADCIARHAGSAWEVCSECGGSEFTDLDALVRCVNCMNGLMQVSTRPAPRPTYAPVTRVRPVVARVRVRELGDPRPAGWFPGTGL